MAIAKKSETPSKGKTVTLPSLLDDDHSDRSFRQFIHNMFAFSSKLEAIRSEFGKLIDLTGIEYTCLIATAYLQQTGTVHVNSLAEHLHLSGAFITLQTNKLAKKGYLIKRKDPDDARRVQLEVTELGGEALESLVPVQRQVNDVLFTGLDHDQFLAMATTFNRLVGNGDRASSLASYLTKAELDQR